VEASERVSNVLLSFTADRPALGVTEIAKQLDMPKSAVHRTLTSLCRTGLVRQESGSAKYRLGLRAIELGLAALDHGDVRAAALPLMHGLTEATGETATLSLLAGRERFYAAQVESPQDVRMTVEIGLRCPLYAGASGRALLAALDEAALGDYLRATRLAQLTESTIADVGRLRASLADVRARGFAAGYGERDPWAGSVAASFHGRDGRAIGSLSVCGPLERFDPGTTELYGGLVAEAAGRLSRELGADASPIA
jgi:DNA-binding IclR family transcriptional regulator